MHRLNASQITAFPEKQKSNKGKNSLLCFLYMATCELLVVVKGHAHREHAVVRLCACVCVCMPSWGREDQRDWGPNISNVVSDFIHSRWRERGGWGRKAAHGGGKDGRKVGTNSPSHRQARVHPSSFKTNQSQRCQLRSTCTPPAREPSPDKSLLITRCTGAPPRTQLRPLKLARAIRRAVYFLSCLITQKPNHRNSTNHSHKHENNINTRGHGAVGLCWACERTAVWVCN